MRESVEMKNGVTDRRQADAAVRWNEERYRTLFDLGPVAVYSCDASGVIQEFNRRAVELWGSERVVGDTDKRFVRLSNCSVRTAVSCRTSSVRWPK